MAIQHMAIPDADRHDCKGLSTAVSGMVQRANGTGGATWVNPSTLNNVSISSSIEGSSTSNQTPSATDTALQVLFGAGSSNSDVSIASNGVITILNDGLYNLTINLNFGRTGTTGVAILLARILVNDVESGFVQATKIDTSANVNPVSLFSLRRFSANDTIKVQIVRDSGGNNDGGLIAVDPVIAGWGTSPSAAVRIQKLAGGF